MFKLPPESNFYQKNQLLISVLVFIMFVVILISSILLAFQGIDNTNYATADADGDLVSNIDEYKAGSLIYTITDDGKNFIEKIHELRGLGFGEGFALFE